MATAASRGPDAGDIEWDREIRMRSMRVDAETGERSRDFRTRIEPASPDILEGFYRYVTAVSRLVHMIGGDIRDSSRRKVLALAAAVSTAASMTTVCVACAPSGRSISYDV